jgi:hypothetical protein
MYRYRAIASFFIWDEVCKTAMDATRRLLEERGVDLKIAGFDRFWKDFHTYIQLLHASGRNKEEIMSSASAVLHYDFSTWLAQDTLGDPDHYRLGEPAQQHFVLSAEGRRELDAALSVWTTHVKGLSKLVTRIKVDWQVRECILARPALEVA